MVKTQESSSKPPISPTMVGIAVATMVLSIWVMKAEARAAIKMRTRRSGAIVGAAVAGAAPIRSLVVSAGIVYSTLARVSWRKTEIRHPRESGGPGMQRDVSLISGLRRNDGISD